MAGLDQASNVAMGLSALMQLIGTPSETLGSASNVTNINADATTAITNLLQQLQGTSQANTDNYSGQASQQYGNMGAQGQTILNQGNQTTAAGRNQMNSAFNSLANIQSQIGSMSSYDPTASTSLFNSNVPMYQQLASNAQQQAMNAFETPAATQAMLNADANVSSAANQYAGLGAATSGAAAAAAAQGASTPLAQLAVDRANLGTSAYQNTLNPLLQQGMQQASNETQMAYNSDVQALINLMQAAAQQGSVGANQASSGAQQASTGANMYGNAASGAAGLSSLYAGLQGSSLSGLSQLGQAEYYSPQVTPGSGLLGWFS